MGDILHFFLHLRAHSFIFTLCENRTICACISISLALRQISGIKECLGQTSMCQTHKGNYKILGPLSKIPDTKISSLWGEQKYLRIYYFGKNSGFIPSLVKALPWEHTESFEMRLLQARGAKAQCPTLTQIVQKVKNNMSTTCSSLDVLHSQDSLVKWVLPEKKIWIL